MKKQEIQAKLAKKNVGFKEDDNEFAGFYDGRKERMIDQAVRLGMDQDEVSEFIDNHGMYEENVQILKDHLNHSAYINPLTIKKENVTKRSAWVQD